MNIFSFAYALSSSPPPPPPIPLRLDMHLYGRTPNVVHCFYVICFGRLSQVVRFPALLLTCLFNVCLPESLQKYYIFHPDLLPTNSQRSQTSHPIDNRNT